MEPYKARSTAKIVTTVVTIIVIIGVVVLIETLQSKAKTDTATAASTSVTQPTTPAADTSAQTGSYKDGTYTASSSYYVPHGQEQIKVTLTVANGVVTDSSIVNSESDRDSQAYQEDFASAYKTKVVGKSLSGLSLSYISGASDTTTAFNDALDTIRTQAQS